MVLSTPARAVGVEEDAEEDIAGACRGETTEDGSSALLVGVGAAMAQQRSAAGGQAAGKSKRNSELFRSDISESENPFGVKSEKSGKNTTFGVKFPHSE